VNPFRAFRFVKTMGGEIEVIAVVKGKRIALHGV